MTVGVGIPCLEDTLKNTKVAKKDVLPFIRQLIQDEIAATESHIKQSQGVSIYESHCVRWGHHLEVYRRIADFIDMLTRKKA